MTNLFLIKSTIDKRRSARSYKMVAVDKEIGQIFYKKL